MTACATCPDNTALMGCLAPCEQGRPDMTDTTMPDWILLEAAKSFQPCQANLEDLRHNYKCPASHSDRGFHALCNALLALHNAGLLNPPADENEEALIDVFQAAGLSPDCCSDREFAAAVAVIRKIRGAAA